MDRRGFIRAAVAAAIAPALPQLPIPAAPVLVNLPKINPYTYKTYAVHFNYIPDPSGEGWQVGSRYIEYLEKSMAETAESLARNIPLLDLYDDEEPA